MGAGHRQDGQSERFVLAVHWQVEAAIELLEHMLSGSSNSFRTIRH
jgi:hypothetical protein